MLRRHRAGYSGSIYVVGVGNGGITAINRLLKRGLYGVNTIAVDTNRDSLEQSQATTRIHVGEESQAVEMFRAALYRPDLVFVVGGLGGQTTTRLAPLLAAAARQQGSLVLAIVTLPFSFEGPGRAGAAKRGAALLQEQVHTLITIPNDRLLEQGGDDLPFHQAYFLAEEVWFQCIHGINQLVSVPGIVNVDFADVKAIMSGGGPTIITRGRASGPQRARLAAQHASYSKLLGITIDGAHSVLFNVAAGPELTLTEVEEAAAVIGTRAHPDANLIFGMAVDFSLGEEMEITVIATGCGVPAAQLTVPRSVAYVRESQPVALAAGW